MFILSLSIKPSMWQSVQVFICTGLIDSVLFEKVMTHEGLVSIMSNSWISFFEVMH